MRSWMWLLLVFGGCAMRTQLAAPPPAPASPVPAQPATPAAAPSSQHYRCDGDMAFDARFGDGSVEVVFANREPETLLRDAGGTSPEVTVYSSTRAKVEFGLGPRGLGAKLNLLDPPVESHCRRD